MEEPTFPSQSQPPPSAQVQPEREGVYRRLARHERGLWLTTIAVVILSAATLAILTVGSAMAGIISGPYRGFVLAGASFLILGAFIAYLGFQRDTIEENRIRIFRELESRSYQLAHVNLALNEAMQTRDIFLNTVSHELKTPLTCIIAYADYLAEEALDPEEVRGHARTIHAEGRNLLRLIDQVMDVTRFRSGTMILEREPVDLNRLAAQLVDQGAQDARARRIELAGEFSQERLVARLDSGRMKEALGAILQRAVVTSGPGTRVTVHARRLDDGWAEVRIVDGSPRLSGAEREALFQPFAQLDPEPSGRSGDLGLSLPLVKRYIVAHGGMLEVSDHEPAGLVYRVQIPLIALAEASGGDADAPGETEDTLDRAS
jgi:two-component system sensor histidine kinase/response regulator